MVEPAETPASFVAEQMYSPVSEREVFLITREGESTVPPLYLSLPVSTINVAPLRVRLQETDKAWEAGLMVQVKVTLLPTIVSYEVWPIVITGFAEETNHQ